MINVIFIKENKNNEIDNYFNNLSLFDNNDKYTYDFIKLLNEQDFIEFVNIKESDNINFITKLINILFNYNSDKIFNTIDINYSDDYLLHIIYDDKATKMLIDAKGFNYLGYGDLDKAIFDLYTEADIEDFDFSYDGQQYLKNKKERNQGEP